MAIDGVYVKLDRPQVQAAVDASIRSAIADVIGKDPQQLIDAVVDAALKNPNGYGRNTQTPFETAVNRMIYDEATKAVGELVDERRDAIRDALKVKVAAQMDLESFAGEYADALVEQLKAGVAVYVNLKIGAPSRDAEAMSPSDV